MKKKELKMKMLELTPYDKSVLAALLGNSEITHVNERIASMSDDGRELAFQVLAINTTHVDPAVLKTVEALREILL